MPHHLRIHIILGKDQNLVPNTDVGWSVTLGPGDLTPTSGLYGYLRSHMHIFIYIQN